MRLAVTPSERAILRESLEETLSGLEAMTRQSRMYMATREPGIALLAKASDDLSHDGPTWTLQGTRAALRALLERQATGASFALSESGRPLAGDETLNRQDPARADELLDIKNVTAALLERLRTTPGE